MSNSIFEQFDKQVDLEGLQKDIEEAKENGWNRRDVPHGEYEVTIDKAHLTTSKKGDPMVSIWFKVVAGEYKNSRIFMNQLVKEGWQFHKVNELLRAMDLDCVNEEGLTLFKSYVQYETLIQDAYEECDVNHLSFALDYGENSKGYDTYEITEVFEN